MKRKLSLKNDTITLAFGAGGRTMHHLIQELFSDHWQALGLDSQHDQAWLNPPEGQLMMATDSYVVSPYFFPGGDIGRLAVYGTCNDLAMGGAQPYALSVSFILEEGLPLADLATIVKSMAQAAHHANVKLVTGDTKVVEKGKGDGIFINTTGIGYLSNPAINLRATPQIGDKLIINGDIGDHGVAILAQREGLDFQTSLQSDCACLTELVQALLQACPGVRCLRDPTRGGVASVLNEWADHYHISFCLEEAALPIKPAVQGACELLGLDPLYIANEGKCLTVCPEDQANRILQAMHAHPLGQNAKIIGEVTQTTHTPVVTMKTAMGGTRRVDWLAGEPLPRIC